MTDTKPCILGYGFILEVIEQTERPTIDIPNYSKKSSVRLDTISGVGSYFKADPGFKPKVTWGRKIVSYIDTNGLIRYKYV
jgi:hypothetical protein